MTQADATKALYQAWMASWPTLSGSIPFVFDNDVIDESGTYARVFVTSALSEQYSLGAPGNRRFCRLGTVVVRLKGPGNVGRKQLDLLVGFVRTIFEGVSLAATGTELGVKTYATSVSEGPPDGQYWQLMLSTPFEFYEIR